jgi:hypothetical protein
MRKTLVTLAAAAGVALGVASPASAVIDQKAYCPYGTLVVSYAAQNIVGDDAPGQAASLWALASYQRTISVVRVAPYWNRFCAATREVGTFSTLAGTSPGGIGFVPAGITGNVYGGLRTNTFTARFSPQVPTSGSIGTFYGPANWLSLYFTDIQGLDLTWWTWTYYTAANGAFRTQADGNLGDITG